jgi:hypothetical protein
MGGSWAIGNASGDVVLQHDEFSSSPEILSVAIMIGYRHNLRPLKVGNLLASPAHF